MNTPAMDKFDTLVAQARDLHALILMELTTGNVEAVVGLLNELSDNTTGSLVAVEEAVMEDRGLTLDDMSLRWHRWQGCCGPTSDLRCNVY